MKRLFFLIFTAFIPALNGCSGFSGVSSAREEILVPAEGPVPGVATEANYADYWIGKLPYPDEPIFSSEEIAAFNADNPLNGTYLTDVISMPDSSEGAGIREYISGSARYLATARLYVTGDIPLEQIERERIIARMDTLGVPDVIGLRFGVVIHRTMGREWPAAIPVMTKPGDNEFDAGVTSSVDTGTPVALLHSSRDGRWALVQTPRFSCWLPAESVAFGDRELVKEFLNSDPPLVTVGDRVPVYGLPDDPAAISELQAGSRLPLRTAGNDYCEILVPGRDSNGQLTAHTGYVRRTSAVSIGYPPYTWRNVFQRLFAFTDTRYGWGGMYEGRDCSRYVMDVFRTFGIELPRNSASQVKAAQVSVSVGSYDRAARTELLGALPGGITLLQMPGHIMVYLGEIDGEHYAISNLWAWRGKSDDGGDVAHRVARVAVTPLTLGEGTAKGAYVDRLTTIAVLGNYELK